MRYGWTYTLRLVDVGGKILVESFLLIGLIAVVRRILVVAAEIESGTRDLTDLLIEIAALGGLPGLRRERRQRAGRGLAGQGEVVVRDGRQPAVAAADVGLEVAARDEAG